MKITETKLYINSVDYFGEKFINLYEMSNFLNEHTDILLDECLIVPYYINDNKRMELYQYEFCCTNKYNFEEYVLNLTGKNCIIDIPQDILEIRRICFASQYEVNKLKNFLDFLFNDKNIRYEIKQFFGDFNIKNLYAIIY